MGQESTMDVRRDCRETKRRVDSCVSSEQPPSRRPFHEVAWWGVTNPDTRGRTARRPALQCVWPLRHGAEPKGNRPERDAFPPRIGAVLCPWVQEYVATTGRPRREPTVHGDWGAENRSVNPSG